MWTTISTLEPPDTRIDPRPGPIQTLSEGKNIYWDNFHDLKGKRRNKQEKNMELVQFKCYLECPETFLHFFQRHESVIGNEGFLVHLK